MTVGRQLFTRRMKSRNGRWKESEGEGKKECRHVSDTKERKWHKGRQIADILRWTEGQRGQR